MLLVNYSLIQIKFQLKLFLILLSPQPSQIFMLKRLNSTKKATQIHTILEMQITLHNGQRAQFTFTISEFIQELLCI